MRERRMTWGARLELFRRWPRPAVPAAPPGFDFSVNDLHVDDETVCPRCLRWISPDDIVRRTAYGPAQHEACPRPSG